MYHGAVGHTVEIPLRVNSADYDTLPVEELRRRSAINTDVAAGDDPRPRSTTPTPTATQLIADQIELFRRGWAGEPQRDDPGRVRARLRPGGPVHAPSSRART